jgi:hypothetical protein
MAVVPIYPLRPTAPMRHVGRRKASRLRRTSSRGQLNGASSRRSVDLAHGLRTVLAALRALWAKTGRQLARNFTSQTLMSLAGVARLVIDCVALGAVLVG